MPSASKLSSRAISGMYFEALKARTRAAWVGKLMSFIPSNQETETIAIAADAPGLTEWVGERLWSGQNVFTIDAKNKRYGAGIEIPCDWVRRDKTGQIRMRINELVSRSVQHWSKLGAAVTLVGPSTLVPHWFTDLGVKVSHDLRSALADAEVVMLLRIQHERQSSGHFPSLGEYTSMFGLNKTRASWLNPKAIIMHPGPINRGVEIDSELADGPRSVILEQVTNGIAVRMAVLFLCAGGQPESVMPTT
jgi:hypothetical protein